MTSTSRRESRRVSTRALLVAGVLVALVLAGVVSHDASTSPDGLERVAADRGFADTAREHGSSTTSPLADYGTRGIDDARVSGGLAGVAGTVLVLVLAGGVALALRRRSGDVPS